MLWSASLSFRGMTASVVGSVAAFDLLKKMICVCRVCLRRIYDFSFSDNACACGSYACMFCQSHCSCCWQWSCYHCKEVAKRCHTCVREFCAACVHDGCCRECTLLARVAIAWCCKNAQQTHNVLLEDVVERLVVIPRDDGERSGMRRRRDSE